MGAGPTEKGSAMQTGEAAKTAGQPVGMYSFLAAGPSLAREIATGRRERVLLLAGPMGR